MSRFILLFGVLLVVIGLLLRFQVELPHFFTQWLGHLPGDLILKKKELTIYIPLTSSFLISVLLSLLFSLFR